MKTNQHLAIIAIEVEIIRLVKVRAYKGSGGKPCV